MKRGKNSVCVPCLKETSLISLPLHLCFNGSLEVFEILEPLALMTQNKASACFGLKKHIDRIPAPPFPFHPCPLAMFKVPAVQQCRCLVGYPVNPDPGSDPQSDLTWDLPCCCGHPCAITACAWPLLLSADTTLNFLSAGSTSWLHLGSVARSGVCLTLAPITGSLPGMVGLCCCWWGHFPACLPVCLAHPPK